MISLTKSLAVELASRDITVNSRGARLGGHGDGGAARWRATCARASTRDIPLGRIATAERHRRTDRLPVLGPRAPRHRRDPQRERRERALRMIVLLFTGGTISHEARRRGGRRGAHAERQRDRARHARHRPTWRRSRWSSGARFPGPHMTVERMWALRNRIADHLARPEVDGRRRDPRDRHARGDRRTSWRARCRRRSRSCSPARCVPRAISDGTGRPTSRRGARGGERRVARQRRAGVHRRSGSTARSRWAKTHTEARDAFESPGLGALGEVDEGA